MNTGKTLFAQLMDFLPWSTFDRIVARYAWQSRRPDVSLCCTISGDGIRPDHLS